MYGKFNHGIWGYPLVGEKKTCGLEIVDAVFQSSHWDRNTVDEQQENNLPQQFVPLGLGEYSTTFYNLPISTTLHRIGHPTQHPSPNWPSGPDDTSNLWQVGLHTRSQGIHHGTKAIQHHRGVIRSLLLISEKAGRHPTDAMSLFFCQSWASFAGWGLGISTKQSQEMACLRCSWDESLAMSSNSHCVAALWSWRLWTTQLVNSTLTNNIAHPCTVQCVISPSKFKWNGIATINHLELTPVRRPRPFPLLWWNRGEVMIVGPKS